MFCSGGFKAKVIQSSSATTIVIPSLHYTSSVTSNQLSIDNYSFFSSFNNFEKNKKNKDLVINKKIEVENSDDAFIYDLKIHFYKDLYAPPGDDEPVSYKGKKFYVSFYNIGILKLLTKVCWSYNTSQANSYFILHFLRLKSCLIVWNSANS